MLKCLGELMVQHKSKSIAQDKIKMILDSLEEEQLLSKEDEIVLEEEGGGENCPPKRHKINMWHIKTKPSK